MSIIILNSIKSVLMMIIMCYQSVQIFAFWFSNWSWLISLSISSSIAIIWTRPLLSICCCNVWTNSYKPALCRLSYIFLQFLTSFVTLNGMIFFYGLYIRNWNIFVRFLSCFNKVVIMKQFSSSQPVFLMGC